MTMLMNWRIVVALMAAFLLAGTHWKAYTIGEANVKSEWNSERLSVAAQSLKAEQDAREKEAVLMLSADTLRRTKNAQIAKLGVDLAGALDRLRNRPERGDPVDLSANPAAGPSCTGASLYRQDSEFLVRESSRADQLRLDLIQCQAAYRAAQAAVNKD